MEFYPHQHSLCASRPAQARGSSGSHPDGRVWMGSHRLYPRWCSWWWETSLVHRSWTTWAQMLPQLQTQADLPASPFRRGFGTQPRHGAVCTKGPLSDGTGWQQLLLAHGMAPVSLRHHHRYPRPMQKVPKFHAVIGRPEHGQRGVNALRRMQPRSE